MVIPAYFRMQFASTGYHYLKVLGKSLSIRIKGNLDFLDFLIDNQQFDAIRSHTRLGIPENWPCHIGRIYPTDKLWNSANGEKYQVVHEFDFLLPDFTQEKLLQDTDIQSEIYFIIALWGIEFAINMGGPVVEGYEKWLSEHQGISPLYYGKNKGVI